MGKPAAKFPGSIATDLDLAIAENHLSTTLSAPMGAGDTQVSLQNPAGVVPGRLLVIEAEIVRVKAGANPFDVDRGWDGTSAVAHANGKPVEGRVAAYHHNALVSEVEAIESFAGKLSAQAHDFPAQSPGGALVVGQNTITLSPVPPGVNGNDVEHYLYISGGVGTAEAVKIVGGSGRGGDASGQITVQCAYTHSGAWTIGSATLGIQEAICALPATGGLCDARSITGNKNLLATVTVPAYVEVRIGATLSSNVMPMFQLVDHGAALIGTMAELVPTASAGAVVRVGVLSGTVEVHNPEVRGLWINGVNTTGTVHGIEGDCAWNPIFRRNRIDQMSGDGIRVASVTPGGLAWGSYFTEISNNSIRLCGGAGIRLKASGGTSVTMTLIESNWCHSNNVNIQLDAIPGSSNVFWTTLINNDLENAVTDGLKLVGASDVWIKSGMFEGSGGWAINRDEYCNKLKVDASVSFDGNASGKIKPVIQGGSASLRDGGSGDDFGCESLQPQGWLLQHHVGVQSSSDTYEIGVNCKAINGSSTQVNLDDTALDGMLIRMWQGGNFSIFTAAAGANPRTLTLRFQVSGGSLLAPNLPSADPGAGSKKFWYDPADGNRVKFTP